jgi:hypothetical protein
LEELLDRRSQPSESSTRRIASWNSGVLGWVAAIGIFLLINGGPRLAKQFARKRQHKNHPVRVKEERKPADDPANQEIEVRIKDPTQGDKRAPR